MQGLSQGELMQVTLLPDEDIYELYEELIDEYGLPPGLLTPI